MYYGISHFETYLLTYEIGRQTDKMNTIVHVSSRSTFAQYVKENCLAHRLQDYIVTAGRGYSGTGHFVTPWSNVELTVVAYDLTLSSIVQHGTRVLTVGSRTSVAGLCQYTCNFQQEKIANMYEIAM